MTAGPNSVPAKLFRGYDTVARGILTTASAVEGNFDRNEIGSTVRVQVCESLSELAEALEIDASLSVSYLKAVEVTAKMDFARKLNVTARSVTIVVYARHGIGSWNAKDVKLKANVKAPTDEKSAASFVKTYGDSFVRSVTLGGEYFAVYIFNTETRDQQQTLAASLKGEGIGTATVKAEAQVKLSNFLKTTKISWTLKQDMTGVRNPDFPDQDKLIPFALGFTKIDIDPEDAAVTNIKVNGYEDLEEFDDSFDKVVDNRDYFLDPRHGLLQKHGRLATVSNQVGWLKRIYQRYGYTADTGLQAFSTKVEKDISAIEKQIRDWKSNAARNFVAPPLPSLEDGEPVLNFSELPPRIWGGEAPGPWVVDSVGDMIRNRTRIKSLQLASCRWNGSDLLGRFIVEYDSDKRSWTETHGAGDVKTLQTPLDLEEGQFPVRFEVRHGTLVDWVRIHVSDGRSTEAGGPGGSADDWSVSNDHFVVGFGGRSGAVIDQLQVRYARLNPAKMVKLD